MLETHKARTDLKHRCLSVFGAKLWNGLNNEIKKCVSFQEDLNIS